MSMPINLPFLPLAQYYLAPDLTIREVAEILGVSATVIRRQAEYWGLPKKQHRLGGDSSQEWTPTPEEIEEACAEIREGWSDAEWERRSRHGLRMIARLEGR